MYLLYRTEKQALDNQKIINSINRQLKVEYSELLSGMDIYNKSKEILMMDSPTKIEKMPL